MNTSQDHPTWLQLELSRAGDGPEEVRRHLTECPKCRQRLASLAALKTSLQAPDEAVPPVAPATDQAVLTFIRHRASRMQARTLHLDQEEAERLAARQWLIPPRERPKLIFVLVLALAIAAAWLWLALYAPATRGLQGRRLGPRTSPAVDVNRDGVLDIVDAYLMAARLKSGQVAPPEWDVNSDARVDEADVRLVAAAAVRLPPEGK